MIRDYRVYAKLERSVWSLITILSFSLRSAPLLWKNTEKSPELFFKHVGYKQRGIQGHCSLYTTDSLHSTPLRYHLSPPHQTCSIILKFDVKFKYLSADIKNILFPLLYISKLPCYLAYLTLPQLFVDFYVHTNLLKENMLPLRQHWKL